MLWEIVSLSGLALVAALVHRQRLQAWQALATSCGLEVVRVSSSKLIWLQLEARSGPATVRIESSSRSKGYSLRVLVTFPRSPGLFSNLKICRRLGPVADGLKAGDDLFDSRFFVEGSSQLMTALLDEETRRLLLGVHFEGELEISGSELRLETFDRNLRELLPLLLALARRLAEPVDVVQSLARNARQDPAAGVRLRNLLALIREHSRDPRTIEALRTACSDPSPKVRLHAARELGAERRDVLFALAESLEDDAVSAEAVSILDRELPCERTQSILFDALRRRCIESARTCLEALGRSGDAAAVDALARVLALEKGELAPAAARALGATGDPAAEAALLQALESEDDGLREAATTALGRVGTAAAVPTLQDIAERSWLDLGLRRAARQATGEIQSRLEGASPGQLSIAAVDAGQLSLVPEAGRLSLTLAEPGQLSLPLEQPEQE